MAQRIKKQLKRLHKNRVQIPLILLMIEKLKPKELDSKERKVKVLLVDHKVRIRVKGVQM